MAYHVARNAKEAVEAAEREAAKIISNPFEDAPVQDVEGEVEVPDQA
jgi:hypothetical protein